MCFKATVHHLIASDHHCDQPFYGELDEANEKAAQDFLWKKGQPFLKGQSSMIAAVSTWKESSNGDWVSDFNSCPQEAIGVGHEEVERWIDWRQRQMQDTQLHVARAMAAQSSKASTGLQASDRIR
jgi:hypothetical protein